MTIDSCSEEKMSSPRMQTLNISVKFRHIKYFFTNFFKRPKALVTQGCKKTLIFLSGNTLRIFYPEEVGAYLQGDF